MQPPVSPPPPRLQFVRRAGRRMIAGGLLLGALFAFGACATRWVSHPRPQHPVPESRRFEAYLFKPSKQRICQLTVVREPGVSGRGLSVYLDGTDIARLVAGEMITVYVKPGSHFVGLKPLFSPAVRQRIVAQRGERTAVRIVDRNGNYELLVAGRGWLASVERTLHISRP